MQQRREPGEQHGQHRSGDREVQAGGDRDRQSGRPRSTVGRRFDLYDDAMRERAAAFDPAELAVIARYWQSLLDKVNRCAAD